MPADACVVGTTRAEGTRAAWSSVSRYMSPFMTYWSLIFAIADANCLGGDATGRRRRERVVERADRELGRERGG